MTVVEHRTETRGAALQDVLCEATAALAALERS